MRRTAKFKVCVLCFVREASQQGLQQHLCCMRQARLLAVLLTAAAAAARCKVKLPHKEVQQLEPLQADLHKALRRPGVSQQSVRVTLSRFTDVGAELLVKVCCRLVLLAPGLLGHRAGCLHAAE